MNADVDSVIRIVAHARETKMKVSHSLDPQGLHTLSVVTQRLTLVHPHFFGLRKMLTFPFLRVCRRLLQQILL